MARLIAASTLLVTTAEFRTSAILDDWSTVVVVGWDPPSVRQDPKATKHYKTETLPGSATMHKYILSRKRARRRRTIRMM